MRHRSEVCIIRLAGGQPVIVQNGSHPGLMTNHGILDAAGTNEPVKMGWQATKLLHGAGYMALLQRVVAD